MTTKKKVKGTASTKSEAGVRVIKNKKNIAVASKAPKRALPMTKKIKVADAKKKKKLSDLEEGLSYDDVSPEDVVDIDISKVKQFKIKANVVRELEDYMIKHAPPGTVADLLAKSQKEALKDMKTMTRDELVNSGTTPFDITLRVLFSLGFVPVEVAPILFQKNLNKLTPDFYYIRFNHKNFASVATDEYTPNLILYFRQNPEVAISLGYCLFFPNQDAFIPYSSGEFKVDITGSKLSEDVVDVKTSIFKKKIFKFLNTFENWCQKVEGLKKVKLTTEESHDFRENVTTFFLNPSRINRSKFLWPKKDDYNPFLVNIAYPDDSNVFRALVNSVMIFVARRKPDGDLRSVRVPYFSCDLSKFYKKNGVISNEDISASKVRLPFVYNRRTLDSISSVNSYMDKTIFSGISDDRAVFFDK